MVVSPLIEPSDEVKTTKITTRSPYVDPPLFTITNPVNYLRRWWKRVISREGIDFRLRIHPVTAFVIILMVGGASFGVGRISVPRAVAQLIPEWIMKPTPTPDPWKETALSGILQRNMSGKFFLVTAASPQAITLQVPSSIDLASSIGKRILASGKYNAETNVLLISDATQIEILLQVAPIRRTQKPSLAPSTEPKIGRAHV